MCLILSVDLVCLKLLKFEHRERNFSWDHDKTPPPSWTNVLLLYESPLVIDRAYRRPIISW